MLLHHIYTINSSYAHAHDNVLCIQSHAYVVLEQVKRHRESTNHRFSRFVGVASYHSTFIKGSCALTDGREAVVWATILDN